MFIKVNGEDSEISDGITIQDLISARKLAGNASIIELNGTIIAREHWESTGLNPDDSLEIIRIIGGG